MTIEVRILDDTDEALAHSKLLDAVQKTIAYAGQHGGIGLTKSKAFNRRFATWAAVNFLWPEYSADQLLRIQKVLNEEDVIPVYVLHELFVSMKLGRHVKGFWQFNKRARDLAASPAALQQELTKGFLFEFDHTVLQRSAFVAPGNWDIWLNVINVEAHGGVSEADLLKTLYGVECVAAGSREYWNHASFLLWHVLRPLSWLGYLEETKVDRVPGHLGQNIYTKTPLWQRTFRLDTDQELKPHVIH